LFAFLYLFYLIKICESNELYILLSHQQLYQHQPVIPKKNSYRLDLLLVLKGKIWNLQVFLTISWERIAKEFHSKYCRTKSQRYISCIIKQYKSFIFIFFSASLQATERLNKPLSKKIAIFSYPSSLTIIKGCNHEKVIFLDRKLLSHLN
jgi:hypothetical protein